MPGARDGYAKKDKTSPLVQTTGLFNFSPANREEKTISPCFSYGYYIILENFCSSSPR